jgi:hypothetical protein
MSTTSPRFDPGARHGRVRAVEIVDRQRDVRVAQRGDRTADRGPVLAVDLEELDRRPAEQPADHAPVRARFPRRLLQRRAGQLHVEHDIEAERLTVELESTLHARHADADVGKPLHVERNGHDPSA